MMTQPTDEHLEQLLRRIQPEPSAAFQQRMADAPWHTSTSESTGRRRALRWAAGIAAALVLALALTLAVPDLRSFAQGVANRFFSQSDDDRMTVRGLSIEEIEELMLTPQPPRPTALPEAKIPTYLPEGWAEADEITAPHPSEATAGTNVATRTYVDGSSYGFLSISQSYYLGPVGYQLEVGASAEIETVLINGVEGEYVRGGWGPAIVQEGPTTFTWDPSFNRHILRWHVDGVEYSIVAFLTDLTFEDLIAIAEGLR